LTLALVGTIVKPVVALADAGAKDSVHGGVDVDEQVTGVRSASAQDPPVQVETAYTHEASMLDIALVSGCTRAINCDVVCSLLTECL
jgi:hypothetical protein